jgi:hypothetical protein
MNLNTLKEFRHEIYGCFERARDALFHLLDALSTEDRARSFPELSLSPHFERRWPSLYEALEDGRIDQKRLQEVFVRYLPQSSSGHPLRIAVDASGIARPKAVTSADRSAQQVHNLPKCEKPVTSGWQFSTLVVLPETPSSWTFLLDQQRVTTQTTAAQVAYAQLEQVVPSLPRDTIALMDRGYDSAWLWCKCSDLPIQGTLIRLKGKRCLYRPAPPATGKRGAPRKWGDKLQPNEETTHANPDGHWEGQDSAHRTVQVTWWQHLHIKGADWLELTVMGVVRPSVRNTKRDPRVSWFVWIGDQDADIPPIALGYVHRFSQEHGYRFDKQSLCWEKPRVRTPEQFERWSHLVAIAHNALVLAREVVEAQLHPWENKQRVPTLQQVRRGMRKFLPHLGTPARPPQPRGKSPGRQKGAKIHKVKRFSVVHQVPKLPPLVPK